MGLDGHIARPLTAAPLSLQPSAYTTAMVVGGDRTLVPAIINAAGNPIACCVDKKTGFRGTRVFPGYEGMSGVRGYIRGTKVYPGYSSDTLTPVTTETSTTNADVIMQKIVQARALAMSALETPGKRNNPGKRELDFDEYAIPASLPPLL